MKRFAMVLLAWTAAATATADEGMWTFDNFPAQKVKKKYGFAPDKTWLDHVRLASARFGGCSASFISPDGLVMTNHHCAHRCAQQLSTAERDLVANGFYARSEKEELVCPALEVVRLEEISDVTNQLNAATRGLEGQRYNDTLKAEMSKIEKACATSDTVRCDVVTLYHGGQYHLYKYHRYQDVRLVFAPEFSIAFFGGDPDNFMFPRYDLDVAFARVYENGKPLKVDHYLKWSRTGAREGELVFVSGHPGMTSRLLTIAELEFQRDVALPSRLLYIAELRGLLTEFQHRGPEQKRYSTDKLFGLENALKVLRGHHEALLDKGFFASKVAAEQALRSKIDADPAKKATYAGAWDAVARKVEEARAIHTELTMIERANGFSSDLFRIARLLVRAGDELPKPNEQRLRELTDSRLPELKQHLFSKAPIHDDLEIATLSWSLAKLRERLGVDHPFVKKVLGKQSPEELATTLVQGSRLKDIEVRRQLFEGGKKAIEASDDPMIRFARLVDADARAVRRKYEDEIESVLKKNAELIAKASFEVYGADTYPDATGTLRLSYGQVRGYQENGKKVAPFTILAGAFERATGRPPFALPQSWLDAKPRLRLETSLNLCTDNDIIGGNSGSPLINRSGEVVGLVFDGNIQSLAGEYGFDESVNRTVSVHSAGLAEALDKIYDADRLLRELKIARAAPQPRR